MHFTPPVYTHIWLLGICSWPKHRIWWFLKERLKRQFQIKQIKKICLNSFFNLFMFSSKSALGRVGGFRGSSADCLQLLRWFFKSGLKRKCHPNLSAGSGSGFEKKKSCLNFFLNLFTFSSKFDLARGGGFACEVVWPSRTCRLQHV